MVWVHGLINAWLCVSETLQQCHLACLQAAAKAEADEREAAHEGAISALRKQLAAEAAKLQDMAAKAADDATAHAAATAKLDSELCAAKVLASGATQELETLRAKACFVLLLCTRTESADHDASCRKSLG